MGLLPTAVYPHPVSAGEVPVAQHPACARLRRCRRHFLPCRRHGANGTGSLPAGFPLPAAAAPNVVARYPAVSGGCRRGRLRLLRGRWRLNDRHAVDDCGLLLDDGLFSHDFAGDAGGARDEDRGRSPRAMPFKMVFIRNSANAAAHGTGIFRLCRPTTLLDPQPARRGRGEDEAMRWDVVGTQRRTLCAFCRRTLCAFCLATEARCAPERRHAPTYLSHRAVLGWSPRRSKRP